MSMNYTQEKLWQAVHALIGAGTIQQRLNAAAQYLIRLRPDRSGAPAFPAMPALESRLNEVLRRLTEHGIDATVNGLAEQDAAAIAEEVLSLFVEATRAADTPVGATETIALPGERH